jgi:recombination protein RecA
MARIKKSNTDKIVESVTRKPKQNISKLNLLPSPSTLLNCACSDSYKGCIPEGKMINIIGDSHSGKTLLALSFLAEAYYHPYFREHRLIYDDAEAANLFDMQYLFGEEVAAKIEAPYHDENGLPVHSDMVEDFHCYIDNALEDGRPFIYILDSLDAVDSAQDSEKFKKMKEARLQNKKVAGTYAMSKPKKMSQLLSGICSDIDKTNSILIIISQTRDNIDPMSFQRKTRSGGRALKFYCTIEMWIAASGAIKSLDEIIGGKTKIKITKTKLTGKVREIDSRNYDDYGVDDINPSIEFLVKTGYWEKKKNTIIAEDFEVQGTQAKIAKTIEDTNQERRLKKLVGIAWKRKEEKLRLNRKPKYGSKK